MGLITLCSFGTKNFIFKRMSKPYFVSPNTIFCSSERNADNSLQLTRPEFTQSGQFRQNRFIIWMILWLDQHYCFCFMGYSVEIPEVHHILVKNLLEFFRPIQAPSDTVLYDTAIERNTCIQICNPPVLPRDLVVVATLILFFCIKFCSNVPAY
jgi:hypothetical protein